MKKMTASELIEYLSLEFSDDHWSDEGNAFAQRAIKAFDISDWEDLKEKLPRDQLSKPVFLDKLVSILSWGSSNEAIPLLLDFTLHHDDKIAYEAFESLRDLPEELIAPKMTKEHLQRLENLFSSASRLEKMTLAESIKRYQL